MVKARVDSAALHVRPCFRKWLRHRSIDLDMPVWRVLEILASKSLELKRPWEDEKPRGKR